jgi:hypothetical protein
MWKNPILIVALVLLAGLLFILTASHCGTPIVPNTQSGQVYVACNFPYPWAWLFGIGRQMYEFNLYLCLAVPSIIIIVLYLQAVIKRRDE